MILKLSLITFCSVLSYVILFGVPFSLFSYHPLLILIALVSITEGIVGVQGKRTAHARNFHGFLQGIGFIAMILGVSVIYYNKDLNNKPHFTSIHGQLGLLTFTYMTVQLMMGSLILYVPILFGGIANAKKMYKYHRISGYLLFVIVWITTLYGVQTPFLLLQQNLLYVYYISLTGILFSVLYTNTKKF